MSSVGIEYTIYGAGDVAFDGTVKSAQSYENVNICFDLYSKSVILRAPNFLIISYNKLQMFSREWGNSPSFVNVFFCEWFPLYGTFLKCSYYLSFLSYLLEFICSKLGYKISLLQQFVFPRYKCRKYNECVHRDFQ